MEVNQPMIESLESALRDISEAIERLDPKTTDRGALARLTSAQARITFLKEQSEAY